MTPVELAAVRAATIVLASMVSVELGISVALLELALGVVVGNATLLLTPLTLVSLPTEAPSADAVVAVVVLGLLCTAAAFVVFGGLVAEIGAGRALVITYVNPVVALALGMAVLGERPGAGMIVGLLLILAGSWLSTDGRLPPGLVAGTARLRRRPLWRAG